MNTPKPKNMCQCMCHFTHLYLGYDNFINLIRMFPLLLFIKITIVTAPSSSSLQQQWPSVVVLTMPPQESHMRPEKTPVQQQVLPVSFITIVTAPSTSSFQWQQPSWVLLPMLPQASHLRPKTQVQQQVLTLSFTTKVTAP